MFNLGNKKAWMLIEPYKQHFKSQELLQVFYSKLITDATKDADHINEDH